MDCNIYSEINGLFYVYSLKCNNVNLVSYIFNLVLMLYNFYDE